MSDLIFPSKGFMIGSEAKVYNIFSGEWPMPKIYNKPVNSKMSGKSLLYVIDPMCSWCWGFSPVFDEIVQRYEGRVRVNILVGGLRPGNTQPFDVRQRDYVLQHWKAVHKRTGQPFEFSFHMPPDFTYDTEPPSRALKVVRRLAPAKERDYLKAIQQAFYVSNTDVTRESVLCQIAERLEVHRDALRCGSGEDGVGLDE